MSKRNNLAGKRTTAVASERQWKKVKVIDAIDVVANARNKMLFAKILLGLLIDMVAQGRLDESAAAVLYGVEVAILDAWEAVERAREALKP